MFIYEKSISHLIKNLQYIQVIYIYMHACTYMGVYLCTRIYNRVFITTIVVMKIRVEILWLLGLSLVARFLDSKWKTAFLQNAASHKFSKKQKLEKLVGLFFVFGIFFRPVRNQALNSLRIRPYLLQSLIKFHSWISDMEFPQEASSPASVRRSENPS